MNLKNIIKGIEQTDAEVCSKLSDRRQALVNFGSSVAAAALPISVSSFFKKAPAKMTVTEALNTALELEYLEHSFYKTANNTAGLIPAELAAGYKTIEAHEQAHIAFFTKAVNDLGGTPFTPGAAHDYTHGGVYDVFGNYETFLLTAQAIEDAGVQAHAMLLETLAGNPLFAQVQQIATAEARHAAHNRMQRRELHIETVPAEHVVNNFVSINVAIKTNHTARSKHAHLGATV